MSIIMSNGLLRSSFEAWPTRPKRYARTNSNDVCLCVLVHADGTSDEKPNEESCEQISRHRPPHHGTCPQGNRTQSAFVSARRSLLPCLPAYLPCLPALLPALPPALPPALLPARPLCPGQTASFDCSSTARLHARLLARLRVGWAAGSSCQLVVIEAEDPTSLQLSMYVDFGMRFRLRAFIHSMRFNRLKYRL